MIGSAMKIGKSVGLFKMSFGVNLILMDVDVQVEISDLIGRDLIS